MQHVWTILKKKSHTCERSAIEINEKENIQDISVDTLSFLTRNENRFLSCTGS